MESSGQGQLNCMVLTTGYVDFGENEQCFDEGRSSCSVKFNMEMDDDKTILDLKLTATTVGILAVKDSTHTIRCITQEIARKAKNNIDNRPVHN